MSDQKAINYEPLSAMKRTAGQAFRQVLSSWGIAFGMVAIICIVGCVLVPTLVVLFVCMFFLGFLGFVLVFAQYQRQDQNEVWINFAAANNWQVDTTSSPTAFLPMSISDGHSQKFSPIIAAQIGSLVAYVFSYETTIGYGKGAQSYLFTLAVAGLTKSLPHMLLINKKGAPLIKTDYENEKLTLEGDFNNFFTLQIDKGQEVDVLIIITPDVMQELLDHDNRESIEITGKDICFILGGEKRTPQDIQGLFEVIANIYPQIAENVSHYSA